MLPAVGDETTPTNQKARRRRSRSGSGGLRMSDGSGRVKLADGRRMSDGSGRGGLVRRGSNASLGAAKALKRRGSSTSLASGKSLGSNSGHKRLAAPSLKKTVFCREDKDRQSILQLLEQIASNVRVCKLVVKDMMSSEKHQNLVDVVERMAFANDRVWESIQFEDSFEISGYRTWRRKRVTMMTDYEAYGVNERSSHLNAVITFKASLTIPEGTLLEEIMKVFKDLKDDPDVLNLTLRADEGDEDKLYPQDLIDMIDWSTTGRPLKDPVTVELECGWSEPLKGYKKFLNCCLSQLTIRERKCPKPRSQRRSVSPCGRAGNASVRKFGHASFASLSPKKVRNGRSGRQSMAANRRSVSPKRGVPARSKSAKASLSSAREEDLPPELLLHMSYTESSETDHSGSRKSLSPKKGRRGPGRTKSAKAALQSREADLPAEMHLDMSNSNTEASPGEGPAFPSNPARGRSPGSSNGGSSSNRQSPKHSGSLDEPQWVEEKKTSEPQSTAASPPKKKSLWRSAVDPSSGGTYYFHKKTMETRWDKPEDFDA